MHRPETAPPPRDLRRLEFIDALRGFALLGVCWANLPIFAGLAYMTDDRRHALFISPLDSVAHYFELFFIETKFMGIFSILFGVSFHLFLTGSAAKSGAPVRLFYRRIFWLLAIGLAHGWLLWSFDILRFYALWGLFLPLFLRMPVRRLLAWALAACVLAPALVAGFRQWIGPPSPALGLAMDAQAFRAFAAGSYAEVLAANWKYDWYLTLGISQIAYQVAVFGHLLLGLGIARALDLVHLDAHRTLLRRVAIGGALIGAVGNGVFVGWVLPERAGAPWLVFGRRLLTESGYLGFSLAYASVLALAFMTMRGRRIVGVLAPMGRMALTCYLVQTLVGIWLFYGFARGPALFGKVGPALLTAICLVEYPVQVVLSRLWLERFRFGPAEWVWRSLTYGSRQPFRSRTELGLARVGSGTA